MSCWRHSLHNDLLGGEPAYGPSGGIGAAVAMLKVNATGDPGQSGERGAIATE